MPHPPHLPSTLPAGAPAYTTRVALLLIALWALLYLPGLGGPELKGEEGRRILPALAMLENGDWVLPTLNGEPYLRKPPLINWVIAASVSLTGTVTEWSVRLPSVLAVLAMALTLFYAGRRFIGISGGLLAAIFYLVNASMLEKGRLAEIEAVYIALSGIAAIWWITAWMEDRQGWTLWLIPSLLNALAILAKGPVPHLLFFYAIAFLLLRKSHHLRELIRLPHLASLLIAGAIVAAWWLPYQAATAHLDANAVMIRELGHRVLGRLDLINLPRALANGLPWIILAPYWWNRRFLTQAATLHPRLPILITTLRIPLFIGFAGIMLIGGMLPRYTLPLYPIFALLLAPVALLLPARGLTLWQNINRGLAPLLTLGVLVLSIYGARTANIPGILWLLLPAALLITYALYRNRDARPSRLALQSALCALLGTTLYYVAAMPFINARDRLRPIGTAIEQHLPPNQPLTVIDPGYQAFFFYIRRPLEYLPNQKNLPATTRYLLLEKKRIPKFTRTTNRPFETVELPGKGKNPFLLLKLGPETETTPSPILPKR